MSTKEAARVASESTLAPWNARQAKGWNGTYGLKNIAARSRSRAKATT